MQNVFIGASSLTLVVNPCRCLVSTGWNLRSPLRTLERDGFLVNYCEQNRARVEMKPWSAIQSTQAFLDNVTTIKTCCY